MAVEGKVVARLLKLDSDAVFWAFRHIIMAMIIVLIKVFVPMFVPMLVPMFVPMFVTVFITMLVVTMSVRARRYTVITLLSLHREPQKSPPRNADSCPL